MADWDEDSPRLRKNLTSVLRKIRASAIAREKPQIAAVCGWHADTMAGLDVPNPEFKGKLRGSPGLEHIGVRVGRYLGAPSAEVSKQVLLFETRLELEVDALDTRYQEAASLDGNGLITVIRLAAWAHAEWIRIHPFANGNGRTARMWANFLFMRYGLPPAIQLRPRPGGRYAQAGDDAMKGNWESTEAVFLEMLVAALSNKSSLGGRLAAPWLNTAE